MPSPSQLFNRPHNLANSPVLIAGLLASAALLLSKTLSRSTIPAPDAPPRLQSSNLNLEQWIRVQKSGALKSLLAAFGPSGHNAPGTAPGIMIASPSRPGFYLDEKTENANYFFHWIRDAGLCLRVILRKLDEAELGYVLFDGHDELDGHPPLIESLELVLEHFFSLNRKIQLALNLSGGPSDGGLGEPKFLIDGSPFNDPWGRPQHDGPAIRASTFIRYAKHLIVDRSDPQIGLDYISTHLFHKDDPNSPIRLDIDHVCRTWHQPSFDLWEEVKANHGGHFYTLMVQRSSLQDFLEFMSVLPKAAQLSDEECESYRLIISKVDQRLEEFWNPDGLSGKEGGSSDQPRVAPVPFSIKPHILPTLDRVNGQPKPSQVDTAVLLAINHTAGPCQPEKWSPASERTLATLDRLVEVFEKAYPINRSKAGVGIAIGRYPEDEYDGVKGQSSGHPWFLCTHAVAETTYLAINQLRQSHAISITRFNRPFFSRFLPDLSESSDTTPTIIERGTEQFRVVIKRMSDWADRFLIEVSLACMDQTDGKMSEQIDRTTRKMRGARELTWSYASLLTAIDARDGKRPN